MSRLHRKAAGRRKPASWWEKHPLPVMQAIGKAGDPGSLGGPDSETKGARPRPIELEVQVAKGPNGLGPQVMEKSASSAPGAAQL